MIKQVLMLVALIKQSGSRGFTMTNGGSHD
jgi:hypothetical protein